MYYGIPFNTYYGCSLTDSIIAQQFSTITKVVFVLWIYATWFFTNSMLITTSEN